MRVVLFVHSLVSDWNHGNAHFLRGIVTELLRRGASVEVLEPENSWSRRNLVEHQGDAVVVDFQKAYPHLQSTRYDAVGLDLDRALSGASIVLVHEWNSHDLVAKIGQHRATKGSYRLYFHDTHHRSVTEPESMGAYDLRHYDGVLAFGQIIRDIYIRQKWAPTAFTWHEAADTSVFYPRQADQVGDLVWIGNWGDEERAEELREFLIEPVKRLGLRATIYGVRYPAEALQELSDAGIQFQGWLPNWAVPNVLAQHRITVHVPRRPYAKALPGIPTIRPFEALACGIPLVSAPWQDTDRLFRAGEDLLFARDGREMTDLLQRVLCDSSVAGALSRSGLQRIQEWHTCKHRVDELLEIDRHVSELALEREVV